MEMNISKKDPDISTGSKWVVSLSRDEYILKVSKIVAVFSI
jgi:hypothetical protein